MAEEAVQFYQEQFEQGEEALDFSILSHVPNMISEEENEALVVVPEKEDVKEVVFKLKGESSCGPNGMLGIFYQTYWDTVCEDVVELVQAFFHGHTLPRAITHTNIVLLPKKAIPETFEDF